MLLLMLTDVVSNIYGYLIKFAKLSGYPDVIILRTKTFSLGITKRSEVVVIKISGYLVIELTKISGYQQTTVSEILDFYVTFALLPIEAHWDNVLLQRFVNNNFLYLVINF